MSFHVVMVVVVVVVSALQTTDLESLRSDLIRKKRITTRMRHLVVENYSLSKEVNLILFLFFRQKYR